MADKQVSYPTTVPLPPLSRAAEVAELAEQTAVEAVNV